MKLAWKKKTENKKEEIEILRIISSFAVVLIHVVYQSYLDFPDEANENYLYLFNFLCFSVPVFVMITGWIWLNPEKQFNLMKSIKRILIPLFSYGCIFALMELVLSEKKFKVIMIPKAIYYVISRQSWAHLWYLYMLIGLYIIIPVLKILIQNISKKQAILIMLVLFVFNSIIIDIEKYLKIDIAFYIPISGVFILYLMLGYYIPQININDKALMISWGVNIAIILMISYKEIKMDSLSYNDILTVWLSFNVYATCFKLHNIFGKIYNRTLKIIAETTFGIYIIHMVFVNVIYKVICFNPYKYQPVIIWFGLTIVIYFMSIFVTLLVRKIPIMNKIFAV